MFHDLFINDFKWLNWWIFYFYILEPNTKTVKRIKKIQKIHLEPFEVRWLVTEFVINTYKADIIERRIIVLVYRRATGAAGCLTGAFGVHRDLGACRNRRTGWFGVQHRVFTAKKRASRWKTLQPRKTLISEKYVALITSKVFIYFASEVTCLHLKQ